MWSQWDPCSVFPEYQQKKKKKGPTKVTVQSKDSPSSGRSTQQLFNSCSQSEAGRAETVRERERLGWAYLQLLPAGNHIVRAHCEFQLSPTHAMNFVHKGQLPYSIPLVSLRRLNRWRWPPLNSFLVFVPQREK